MTGDRDDLAARLTAALERLAQTQRTLRLDAAYQQGVSASQLAVLQKLADSSTPSRTAGQLAGELGVSAATMSDTVAALRRKDLVTRTAGEGRGRPLQLTARGRAVLSRAEDALEPFRAAVSSLDEENRANLLAGVLRLVAELQRRGVITVARMCTTCRFFDTSHVVPRCDLLGVQLPPAALRVDCPEHQPAA